MMQHLIGFIFHSLENMSAILTESLPENEFESFLEFLKNIFKIWKTVKLNFPSIPNFLRLFFEFCFLSFIIKDKKTKKYFILFVAKSGLSD